MSFLVDSDSESQLEVLFHITDEIFPFKTSYHRRCPQLFHKGCTILVVFYCVGAKLGLRRQDELSHYRRFLKDRRVIFSLAYHIPQFVSSSFREKTHFYESIISCRD